MLKSIWAKYVKRSFFNKILLAYSIITICSILILTSVLLYSFTQTLESRELSLNRQIVNRVSAYIDRKYRNALTIYQRLYAGDQSSSTRPIFFFEPPGSGNADRDLRAKANLEDLIKEGFQLDPDIHDIVVRRYSGDDWFISESIQAILREPYQTPVDLALGADKASGFAIQKAHLPEYRNNLRAIPVQTYTMAAAVMSGDLSRRLGEIYVEFTADRVKDEYREYAQNLKGYLLILTPDGEVMFDSSSRYYGSRYPYFDQLMAGRKELKLEAESVVNVVYPAESGVVVAGVIPKSEIYTVSGTIRQTVYLVSAACLIATLALAYLSTSVTSRRVKEVTEAMKTLRGGDLSARIPMGSQQDELGEIAQNFNHMCGDLQGYINKVYLAEIRQKNAELNALQSQINPHFLYNTLEAIRMKAITKGDEDAGDMIRLLAALFRSAIRDEMIITVQDELKYCGMYLDIFKIRYSDRLVSDTDVEEDVLSSGIPKHLLQPVVENYILHGFDPDRQDNRISMAGRLDACDIVFEIRDNGSGIGPDRLKALRESMGREGREGSIGLPNVNERIKLIYGERYGLEIDSRPNAGTTVTIRIKFIGREELKLHVQDIDRRR